MLFVHYHWLRFSNNNILFTLNELSLIWIHSRKANRLYDCDNPIANYILEFQQLRFEIKGILKRKIEKK